MVCQSKIKIWVRDNIHDLPHFIVLVGDEGSGKKTMAKYIADELHASYAHCTIDVATVRNAIDVAYASATPVVYCFSDADNMKAAGQNALLKITEEPPENAWLIITVEHKLSLLDTVLSRAHVIEMLPYERWQLNEFMSERGIEGDWILRSARNPGDVLMLAKYGEEFYDYVKLVAENITEVEPANAFKSAQKLALKSEEGKWDLRLFFNTMISICVQKVREDRGTIRAAVMVGVTARYLSDVTMLGVNKSQLYDKWVFEIREAVNDIARC